MSVNCDKDQISFNFSGSNGSDSYIRHKSNHEPFNPNPKKSGDSHRDMLTPRRIEDLTEEQEERLDKYVDNNGCSYAVAFDTLYGKNCGLEDEVDSSSNAYADLVEENPSSDLTEGWSRLEDALSDFEGAESYNGFIKQLESRGAQDSEIERIEKKRCAIRRMGVEKFNQAFGTDGLIEAGFDKKYVLSERQKALDEFLDKYVGPGKDKQRKKFGKNIVKYCGSVK